jgi:arylsulfatase A-like enzyme
VTLRLDAGVADHLAPFAVSSATDLAESATESTIGSVLKTMGYATGHFGNNHLGDKNEFLPTVRRAQFCAFRGAADYCFLIWTVETSSCTDGERDPVTSEYRLHNPVVVPQSSATHA